MSPVESMHEPVTLFEWLPELALASGRKMLTAQQVSVAMFIALSTKGKTGQGGTIDADRLAMELDISVRQVWRYVDVLTDGGWIERTQKPTRGTKGRPGRKARYRLTRPHVVLSHDPEVFACHDDADERHTNQEPDRVPDPSDEMSHEVHEEPVDNPNRVTFPAESCDIAERDPGTVTPADGSTTTTSTSVTTGADAARDELARARQRRQAGAR